MDEAFQSALDRCEVRRAQAREGQVERMLAIDADTGRLLNILVRSLEAPRILELGTACGYSGLWLAQAAKATGGHVTTVEIERYKADYARAEAVAAGLGAFIEHRVGDALPVIAELEGPGSRRR